MAQYQVTLICTTGQYKPVSTLIDLPLGTTKKEIIEKGIIKIAQKRRWTNADLKRLGYTSYKARKYDAAKIAKQNAERYEQIKKERGWK